MTCAYSVLMNNGSKKQQEAVRASIVSQLKEMGDKADSLNAGTSNHAARLAVQALANGAVFGEILVHADHCTQKIVHGQVEYDVQIGDGAEVAHVQECRFCVMTSTLSEPNITWQLLD